MRLALALLLAAQSRSALSTAADKAVADERWCDAAYLFAQLDELAHDPKNVFNAAEVARAANDRARALALYQELLVNDPGFKESQAASQAVDELTAEIAKRGPGTACPAPRAVCGNGVVELGEVCDGGEGCSVACARVALCGNGEIEPGETCDDGNNAGGDGCSVSCHPEVCGNSILDPGEMCDDGNRAAGDGCGPTCLIEGCGNGIVDPGEACDDGNRAPGDGCAMDCMKLERCGDGVVDVGELCDDGDGLSGDGCSASCVPEVQGKDARDGGPRKGGGTNLAGWGALGGGGLLAVLGGAGVVIGAVEWLDAQGAIGARDTAADDLTKSVNATDYVTRTDALAASTASLDVGRLKGWNDFGRFGAPGGVALAVGGVGVAVIGALMLASGGAE